MLNYCAVMKSRDYWTQKFSTSSIEDLAGRASPAHIFSHCRWDPEVSVPKKKKKTTIIWVGKKKKSLGKSWNDFQLPLLSENKEEAPHHLSRQISMHHQVLCRVLVSHDELGHTFSWRGYNAAAEVKSLVHTPVLLQDLGTELFCLSHPQRAKLIFFSLDYYFFFLD